MRRITLVTEGDADRISGGYLYQRRVLERAGAHGIETRVVAVPARRFPLALVDGPRVLRAAARDADVVVVDSLASNTLGPWIALGLLRRPMVGSVHQRLGGTDLSRLRTLVQRWFDRLAFRRCRHVLVPSALLAEQLARDGLDPTSLHVIAPGRDVPEAAGTTIEPLDLRHGRRAGLLCIANWVERKGILAVLDAVAQLPDDTLTLHLVGDEDIDQAFRARVLARLERADLAERVVRHGVVDPRRIPSFFAAADVFVLASTEEPYGMVYAEAMVAGVPVVGWDAGNLPHLVTDGAQGRLLPAGDIDALAHALATLAGDPALRAAIGRAGRERAARLPTWDETAASFVELCRRAVQGR